MLIALGADPSGCGYTREQIRECLAALGAEGAHQETVAVDHLRWMLDQRGELTPDASNRGRQRPEVTRLRFHAEASPDDWLPEDIRRPLFGILLEQADGAVMMKDRRWVEYDPLASATAGASGRTKGETR